MLSLSVTLWVYPVQMWACLTSMCMSCTDVHGCCASLSVCVCWIVQFFFFNLDNLRQLNDLWVNPSDQPVGEPLRPTSG